ncbi:MAG: methylated-DNA--[protein]-cysteine S-methyltransferase [Thermoplasmata archaeon]|nr:methylated-DNA--[protein]-cysteine S-methyltransferase [Thermoplasmata archaeon]
MRGPCISSFLTLLGTVNISEDGEGMITGVFLPCCNLPPMDQCETDALREAAKQINQYLAGKRMEFDLDLRYDGSDFRSRVMEELNRIPYGEVRTYKQIAEAIGYPNSMRAVGTACRENPLPILVPCHRVIPSTGGYGNYSGGASLKKRLLNLEGVHLDRLQKDHRGISRARLCGVHLQADPGEDGDQRGQGTCPEETGEADSEG